MSSYFIRYAARCRYDGETVVHSADTKETLASFIKVERQASKEANSYFEVEEKMFSVYERIDDTRIGWICDCPHMKYATKIAKCLNFLAGE